MTKEFKFTPLPAELTESAIVKQTFSLEPASRVYANRDLSLADIKMVGFDMDYTLAIYKKEPMERLQYELTRERLVTKQGYPKEILDTPYDPWFIIRGLTVDKRTGHLLKLDNHGQISRCYRGLRRLEPKEYEPFYRNTVIKHSSDNFASLDTLFAMPEACLFANLVDFYDKRVKTNQDLSPVSLPQQHETPNLGDFDTWRLFHDVRNAIDDIHRDGTLKSIIMADLPSYIEVDDGLPLTLHKLRSAGKRLFLLTNSYWSYTDVLMKYLLDGTMKEYASWRGFFDVILVGGRKPGFFTARENFVELDISGPAPKPKREISSGRFDKNKVYQGGNMEAFEAMTHCTGGEILYVGDHIFGDILRSKKESGWRTCLIVEELEEEIRGVIRWRKELRRLDQLDSSRHQLDDLIGQHRAVAMQLELYLSEQDASINEAHKDPFAAWIKNAWKEIDRAKRKIRRLDKEVSTLHLEIDARFNSFWGRLLKDNNELSRFGHQVADYACIYCSRVSNFLQYSPVQYFRAPREIMSHDDILREQLANYGVGADKS
jgi:5'-nucleotidase